MTARRYLAMDRMTIFFHYMTAMKSVSSIDIMASYARYLPPDPVALAWGLHVVDAGFTDIPGGSSYPPQPHPDGYMFSWGRGRSLDEYQMVYIIRGRGVFESHATGHVKIEAGDVFLLFPGVWHRYRPSKSTGWDENWIGFDGAYARKLMPHFFSPDEPVWHSGYDEELLRLIRSVTDLMQTVPPGARGMMAGNTISALARVRALVMRRGGVDVHYERKIHEACCIILERATEEVDLPALARQIGYSYSHFRAIFKRQTGMSPHQYQIQIRINRAREFLTSSDQSVTEIAERLGFCSVSYFSRLFKEWVGDSPHRYRSRNALSKRGC